MKAIVSNGSKKFHLAPLAAELSKSGLLTGFLTAGWPTNWVKFIAEAFPTSKRLQRLLDRKESIPDDLVFPNNFCEVFIITGDLCRKISIRLQQKLHKIAFLLYSLKAKGILKKIQPDIYHYRNCYGGMSVNYAKKLGISTLSDHSIAHPVCLNYMVRNKGKYPDKNEIRKIESDLSVLEKCMLDDLHHEDHLLVNSDFVKETCVYIGMDPNRIHVVYLGVDDSFFSFLPVINKSVDSIDILYAGGWEDRKGVETLIDALDEARFDWRLSIAGGISPNLDCANKSKSFIGNSKVNYMGVVPRKELAILLKKHRIFVFPSYCEGSARVIFEAMAAGCYIITTPNSGSIVQDGVHGAIVESGDSIKLRGAIQHALLNNDYVDRIGKFNSELISKEYRQSQYAENVLKVYEKILK